MKFPAKKWTCFTWCLYKEQVMKDQKSEMHQKPSKPLLPRSRPLSVPSCGERGSIPAQGPLRFSCLQILLALPTLGSFRVPLLKMLCFMSWPASHQPHDDIPRQERGGWVCLGRAAAEPHLPAGDRGAAGFSGCERCRTCIPRWERWTGMGMGMCEPSCVQGEAWQGIVFCLTGLWIQDREHSKAGIFLNNIAANFPRFLGGF